MAEFEKFCLLGELYGVLAFWRFTGEKGITVTAYLPARAKLKVGNRTSPCSIGNTTMCLLQDALVSEKRFFDERLSPTWGCRSITPPAHPLLGGTVWLYRSVHCIDIDQARSYAADEVGKLGVSLKQDPVELTAELIRLCAEPAAWDCLSETARNIYRGRALELLDRLVSVGATIPGHGTEEDSNG